MKNKVVIVEYDMDATEVYGPYTTIYASIVASHLRNKFEKEAGPNPKPLSIPHVSVKTLKDVEVK